MSDARITPEQSSTPPVRVTSIRAATIAFIRHRFVRANYAGSLAYFLLVLVVVGLLPTVFYIVASGDASRARSGGQAGIFFLFVGIGLIVLIGGLMAASLVYSLVERVHRRMLGVAGVVLYAIFTALGGACVWVCGSLGWIIFEKREALRMDVVSLVVFDSGLAIGVVLFAVFAVAQIESLLFCWWSIFAPRDQFVALRGWRPPALRLFANFTRQMGLPAFLSAFARGRLRLTVYFLLIAILDAFFFVLLTIPVSAGPFMLETAQIFNANGGIEADISYAALTKVAEETNPAPAVMAALLAIIILAPRLLRVGTFVRARARRRAVRLYQDVREWDPRRPIIYLRAFDIDKLAVPATRGNPLLFWLIGQGRPATIDELLLDVLSPWGPVVAIGDPRDPLPPLGAARVFVQNAGDEWQEVVRSLLEAASAIVIAPNRSAGVGWELAQVAQRDLQSKTIYIANPRASAEEANGLFAEVLGASTPMKAGERPVAAFRVNEAWRVLSAPEATWQSISISASLAAQTLLGERGVALTSMRRPTRKTA